MSADLSFVFLQCSERSGSNFITRLFDAHPEVCGPSPAHVLRLFCDHAHRYGDLAGASAWATLAGDVATTLDVKIGTWATQWTAEQLAALAPQGDVAGLFRALYGAEARANNKHRVFLKENHLYRHLPFVLSAFPGARFVFQVRDPRDMALSWKNARELRGDVARASAVWARDQTAGLSVLGQLRALRKMVWLRYEDLVDAPEETLSRVCAGVGLAFHPQMLRFHEGARAAQHASASQTWSNVARPVMRGNHGKWKGRLSDDELTVIEWRCGGAMDALGYARALPPVSDEAGAAALARILPLERHEKPAYQSVPPAERATRARAAAHMAALRDRPIVT